MPPELLAERRWVAWRYETRSRHDKPTKVPYRADGGGRASSTSAATWSTFAEAAAAAAAGDYAGVGFALGDGFAGIDIDHCLTEAGTFAWGSDIPDAMIGTYAERSPSRTGVKLFLRGRKPAGSKATARGFGPDGAGRVEAYDAGRWFAFTGKVLDGHPLAVAEHTTELAVVCKHYGLVAAGASSAVDATVTSDAVGRGSVDAGDPSPAAERAVAAMLRMNMADAGDWSRRLYAYACRCVEHDLTDGEAVAAVRAAAAVKPFPAAWSDADIVKRVRDAERQTTRGSADAPAASSGIEPHPLTVEPYQPFPVDILPATVARFVTEGAAALGCDPAYVALPVLVAVAAAVGNARRVRLKNSWTEPLVLWGLVVAESGTLKSPAFDLAVRPLHCRDQRAADEHAQAMVAHAAEAEKYVDDLKAWRKAKPADRGERPVSLASPRCARLVVTDATVEALAVRLADNPRGLLLARDEAAGWLAGFNQYKAGGVGADEQTWLELHRAGLLAIERKTGDRPSIRIPRAAVCVVGGVQPATLAKSLTRDRYGNGLAARLLLVMPPRRPKQWTEADIDPATEVAMAAVFDALLSFVPLENGEPVDVGLDDDAKALWVAFYNEHAGEQNMLTGDRAAAWSKLEGYAARLAAVIHCARHAAGESVNPDRCDAVSMKAGIALARWFGRETMRVYAALSGGTASDGDGGKLVDLIRQKGGRITTRKLSRSSRQYQTADAAERALDALVTAGVGGWEYPRPDPKGGHPTKVFVLTT